MVNVTSLTFCGGMPKNSGPNPRSFPKNNYQLPPRGQIVAPKHIFTPIFRLHTVTTGFGDRPFGYFLRPFHVFTEIYPLVPFPSSVREGVSDVTADVLRWGAMTSARTAQNSRHVDRKLFKMRELRGAGRVVVRHIPGETNPADLFTKILTKQPFEKHCTVSLCSTSLVTQVWNTPDVSAWPSPTSRPGVRGQARGEHRRRVAGVEPGSGLQEPRHLTRDVPGPPRHHPPA